MQFTQSCTCTSLKKCTYFSEKHLTVSYNVYIIDYIREMEIIGNVVKVYRKR